MEPKRVILISIVLGLVGMLLSFTYLRKKEQAIVSGMNPVAILVAAKDIPEKSMIAQNMLRVVKIPEKFIEPKTVRVNDEKTDMSKVIGMVNLVPLFAGQQIMQSQLVPPTEETGLAVKVPMTKRGMIVPIANVDIADLIKPGDYVDILNTFSAKLDNGGNTKVTITVLQNVQVLGVGKDLGEVAVAKKKEKDSALNSGKTVSVLTISIAVAPEEAQLVALAEAQGDLYITIRGRNDSEGVLVKPVDTTMFLKQGA